MPEHWNLNGFFDMAQTTNLYESIGLRESCRNFLSAPSTRQWEDLQHAAEKMALPGVRLSLGMCDDVLFRPFFGLLMKFENVQRYAAVITCQETQESDVNAGISGEMLMLKAVSMDLGGVWVAGTYKRGQVKIPLQKGEKVRALIALGVPNEKPVPPLKRNRKSIQEFCSPNFDRSPGLFREAAALIRVAPSAMNMQPWRLRYEEPGTLAIAVKRAGQRLDLGIAVCHALLAMGTTPVQYTLSEDGRTARIIAS